MRATVTTTTTALITGPSGGGAASDASKRSYVVFSPTSTGTVLLKPAASDQNPATLDMSDAARWDFSLMALNYELEPGRTLFAKTASGSAALDILEGGER